MVRCALLRIIEIYAYRSLIYRNCCWEEIQDAWDRYGSNTGILNRAESEEGGGNVKF